MRHYRFIASIILISLCMVSGNHNVSAQDFDPNELMIQLSGHLEKRYCQLKEFEFKSLETAYLSRLYWINEIHTFKAEETFHGKIIGIDDTGKLIVSTENEIRNFIFKEIEYLS